MAPVSGPATVLARKSLELFEAISTENLITDRCCHQLSAEQLAARRAAAKAPLDGLAHLNVPYLFRHPEPPLDISKARFVNSTEGMALLRHSTPAEAREAIEAKALGREADFGGVPRPDDATRPEKRRSCSGSHNLLSRSASSKSAGTSSWWLPVTPLCPATLPSMGWARRLGRSARRHSQQFYQRGQGP